MMVVSSIICYKDCFYTLSWWSGDVAYYQPAYGETVAEGCGWGIKWLKKSHHRDTESTGNDNFA